MAQLVLELWQTWVGIAGVTLGLAATLIGLIYALAGLLMNEKMKSWAKMELSELFYSAIIIAIGIGGITTMDELVQGAFGVSTVGSGSVATAPGFQCLGTTTSAYVPVVEGHTRTYQCLDICGDKIAADETSVYHEIPSCHIRLGIWYLRELFDETKTFAFDIYLSYITTSIIEQFTINIEYLTEMAGFFTFTPWKGFYTMGNKIKEQCFDWATKLMMLLKFQEVLLRFIATGLFPVLFVSGAIMRAFAFTRRLGGLLLAMAITLYFIFPAFYAFGALVMLDLKNQAYPSWVDQVNQNPANPACRAPIFDCKEAPDPPIANSMYINGSMAVLGGQTSLSAEDAHAALSSFEGMNPDEYMEQMENAQTLGILPQFDLTSQAHRQDTEPQRLSALAAARGAANQWFGVISGESKFDNFINTAWSANGPLETMARLTFWSSFFSIVGIIGCIATIRSLSMTFGGDIEIAGLTRLI